MPFPNEQGRIQGYPSRIRVSRSSDEFEQPSSWAGAVTPKPTDQKKLSITDRQTDRQTDRRTEGHSGLENRVHATKKDTRLALNESIFPRAFQDSTT